MLLFVYGTLKKGHRNHNFLRGCEFVVDAKLPGFALYDLGAFPCVAPQEDSIVHGEVYQVTDFTNLDRLEGYSEASPKHSMYLREWALVDFGDDPVARDCYVYVWNQDLSGRPIIKDGVWRKS